MKICRSFTLLLFAVLTLVADPLASAEAACGLLGRQVYCAGEDGNSYKLTVQNLSSMVVRLEWAPVGGVRTEGFIRPEEEIELPVAYGVVDGGKQSLIVFCYVGRLEDTSSCGTLIKATETQQ